MDAIKISSIASVSLSTAQSSETGSLHLTPHQIIFKATRELAIPYPLLYSVKKSSPSNAIVLRTRDFVTYSLQFTKNEDCEGVWDTIKAVAKSQGVEDLYAFHYYSELATNKEKLTARKYWEIYDPVAEFQRMGVGSRSHAWRFSDINHDYEFCPTYPGKIVVPSKISDTTLGYAVKYRSKGRLPGLVYLHWSNLGSITRSSQPMVGLKNNRSIQDEKLIESIFTSHSQHSASTSARSSSSPLATTSSLDGSATSASDSAKPNGEVSVMVYGATATNIIIDARPTTNAMANSVKGAGTENMEFYKNCKKSYLGIDNIHVMRNSLIAVHDALNTSPLSLSALHKSSWLKHLTSILEGILLITRTLHLTNSHILIHCSDGWDRTSQLSSVAQVCLDKEYRTGLGFARLIEKDWGTFGHKFGERLGWEAKDRIIFEESHSSTDSPGGYGYGEGSNGGGGGGGNFLSSVQKTFMGGGSSAYKETSPVLHQLLSTLYQLLRQFPTRFEFNELFLRRLLEESFGGKWGNFLWNSEEERKREGAKEKTRSVWELFFDLDETKGLFTLKEEFRNSLYAPEEDDATSRDMGVLLVDPTDVKWWFELYGRTDLEMNPPPLPSALRDLTSRPSSTPAIFDADELEPDMEETIRSPLPTSTSPLPPPPSQSASPYTAVPLTTAPTEAEQAISAALSSATKFGWGAWKSVKKGYQGAVENYRDSSAASSPTTPPGNGTNLVKGRANGEELDSVRAQKTSVPTTYATYNRSGSASRTASSSTSIPPKNESNPWSTSASPTALPAPPPPPKSLPPPTVPPPPIPSEPLSPTTNPETTVFSQKTVQEIIGDSEADSTSFSLEDDDEDEEVALVIAGVERSFDPLGVGMK